MVGYVKILTSKFQTMTAKWEYMARVIQSNAIRISEVMAAMAVIDVVVLLLEKITKTKLLTLVNIIHRINNEKTSFDLLCDTNASWSELKVGWENRGMKDRTRAPPQVTGRQLVSPEFRCPRFLNIFWDGLRFLKKTKFEPSKHENIEIF